jgi:hypothetical protein
MIERGLRRRSIAQRDMAHSEQMVSDLLTWIARSRSMLTPGDSSGPRIHDLRHTFAVRTLLSWYREGEDIEKSLPVLSTYLGHTCVRDTYWYLSAYPALMQEAVRRLDRRWEVKTVGVLSRPQASIHDIFRELGSLFGVQLSTHNRWAGCSKVLRERWQEHIDAALVRPVLIVDEAQEMVPKVLAELRKQDVGDLVGKALSATGDQNTLQRAMLPPARPSPWRRVGLLVVCSESGAHGRFRQREHAHVSQSNGHGAVLMWRKPS